MTYLGSLVAISIISIANSLANSTTVNLAKVAEVLPGQVVHAVQPLHPALEYLLYVPESAPSDSPILVVVHGISRSADEQISFFIPFAEAHGFTLVAPYFSEEDYPDYQRLGRRGRGLRADLALEQLLTTLPRSLENERVFLFGFSGGAQFVHRFVMAHSEQVIAAVVAAAGWYTFPDSSVAYPYGLRLDGTLPAVQMNPGGFLEVPTLAVVGSDDTDRDANLRRSRAIDRRQGRNRVERAQRWIAEMSEAAERRTLETPFRLAILEDCDHSFENCMNTGMGELIFDFIVRGYQEFSITTESKING